MRALDRLSEGDGDEPQPAAPGASGAGGCDVKPIAGTPAEPVRVNVRRRRRDAGTPEMYARMERTRAARDQEQSRQHVWHRGLPKVEAMLSDEHRREYDALLRDPTTTLAVAREWLRVHGYRVGIRAVANHRRLFQDSLKVLREAARFAGNLRRLFGIHGPTAMSDVTLTRVQQALMERLYRCDEEGNAVQIGLEELADLSKMVESAIRARQRVERMRREFEEMRDLIVGEVDQVAKRTGADGQRVVNRVKQLLGVPLGPETPEEAAAAQRQYVPFDLAELENSAEKVDPGPKT